jgi:hypothetical protein
MRETIRSPAGVRHLQDARQEARRRHSHCACRTAMCRIPPPGHAADRILVPRGEAFPFVLSRCRQSGQGRRPAAVSVPPCRPRGAVPVVCVRRAGHGKARPALSACAVRTVRPGLRAREVPEQGKMGLWVPCRAARQRTGRGSGLRCQAAGSGPSSPFQAMTALPNCWRMPPGWPGCSPPAGAAGL